MAKKHVVRQGETLPSIARKHGVLDWNTIWDAPDNDALKKKRKNPHVLFPGDELAIPDPPGSQGLSISLSTGESKEVTIEREPTMLRLKVLDVVAGKGEPAEYELEVEGLPSPKRGEISASGEIEVAIPDWARRGRISLLSKENGETLRVLDLEIGALDPASTPSGLRERLRRLGYDPGGDPPPYEAEKEDAELTPALASALRAFQGHHGLAETGAANDETRDKLVELTGA